MTRRRKGPVFGDVDGGNQSERPDLVWEKLTRQAQFLLRTIGRMDAQEVTAYVIEGEPTQGVSAALTELQLLGLIEAVRIPGEKAPGYFTTPKGVGVLMLGVPQHPDAATQRVAEYLNRRDRG